MKIQSSERKKKTTANQEYSTWKNCPWEMKEKKIFPEKQKLREVIITRPALQEMQKGVLQVEMKLVTT